MYVNFDVTKNKIVSVTKNPLVTMKQNIISKEVTVDPSETLLLPNNFVAKYDGVDLIVELKPIDQVKNEYIKIINEYVQSLIERLYQDWGVTYIEIIAELHNTGLNIESKIYFLLKSEITSNVYNIGDIRSMAGEVAFGATDLNTIVNNLTSEGLVSVDLFTNYMNKYVDIIRSINNIENAWDDVEEFEANISNASTITECNNLFSSIKSKLMVKLAPKPSRKTSVL